VRVAYHDLAEDDGDDETNRERKVGAEMQDILEKGDNKHPSQGNDTTYDISEREIKLFHITGHPFCMHAVKLMFIIYSSAYSLFA
jgi:hypothetical protein